jgi:CRP-like cAMP-binding protein
MPFVQHSAVRNRLLALLPPGDFGRLAPHLRPGPLTLGMCLQEPDQPIETVWFPETGMVSMLARLEAGDVLEVGVIGREGLVGLPVVLGVDIALTEATVQLPGNALIMRAAALKEQLQQGGALWPLLLRYVHAAHAQVAQTAACNGRHTVEQRLARWLLMAHDRAEGDDLALTQELLSHMLGVRRAGVTVAAGILQRAGLIDYAHGRITIRDRAGLEATSCECYRAVATLFDQLLGPERRE